MGCLVHLTVDAALRILHLSGVLQWWEWVLETQQWWSGGPVGVKGMQGLSPSKHSDGHTQESAICSEVTLSGRRLMRFTWAFGLTHLSTPGSPAHLKGTQWSMVLSLFEVGSPLSLSDSEALVIH